MTRWTMIMVGTLFLILPLRAAELGKTLIPLDASKVAVEETAFGNFVADAMRQAAEVDIAILPAMAFRATARIPAGVVDEQMIRGSLAQPSSKITVLKLTPAQLRSFMERSLSRVPDFSMGFLQFSGMQVRYDGSKPEQNRVVSITVGEKALDLTDSKAQFKVAMPRELATGAVGYVLILPRPVIDAMVVTDTTLLEAVSKAFAGSKNREINPGVDERLKNINPPKKVD